MCTFAGGGHARLKVEAACKKFVNNNNKNNKSKKKRQTTKTNTHKRLFLLLLLRGLFSYIPPLCFFKREQGVQGGREGEGEEVFWLFYLVDDLMDWSSCWNLLNADWPGWPDREKFDWRVVVTKIKPTKIQIEWSWWMDGLEKIPSVLDWTVDEPNALLLLRWIMSVGPENKKTKNKFEI